MKINDIKKLVSEIVEEKLIWNLYRHPDLFETVRQDALIQLSTLFLCLEESELKDNNENLSYIFPTLIKHLKNYNPSQDAINEGKDEYALKLANLTGLIIKGYRNDKDPFCPTCKSSFYRMTDERWEEHIHPIKYLNIVKKIKD